MERRQEFNNLSVKTSFFAVDFIQEVAETQCQNLVLRQTGGYCRKLFEKGRRD